MLKNIKILLEYQKELAKIDFAKIEKDKIYEIEGEYSGIYKMLRLNRNRLIQDQYTEDEVLGENLIRIKDLIEKEKKVIQEKIEAFKHSLSKDIQYITKMVHFDDRVGIESYLLQTDKVIIYGKDPIIDIFLLNRHLIDVSSLFDEGDFEEDAFYSIDRDILITLKEHFNRNRDAYKTFYLQTTYPEHYYKKQIKSTKTFPVHPNVCF